MKLKSLSLLVMAGSGYPLAVQAADSPHSLSANVSLTSNYVFRGISQTSGGPAIQGGFDYSHSSGFYLGTWASNVSWLKDFQGYDSGSMEIDFYGGFRNSFGDISYDLGGIRYQYPGDKGSAYTANTSELYASLGWKWFTAKYSYYVSEGVFGFGPNADGSDYFDISASYPVGETGLTLGAHWGTFDFENFSGADYEDWKVSATYDLGKLSKQTSGMTFGIAYTDTNADKTVWTNSVSDVGEYLGKGTTTVWISKAF